MQVRETLSPRPKPMNPVIREKLPIKIFCTNIPQSLLMANSNRKRKTVLNNKLPQPPMKDVYKQRIQKVLMPPSLTAFNVNQSYLTNLEHQLQSSVGGPGNSGFRTTKKEVNIASRVVTKRRSHTKDRQYRQETGYMLKRNAERELPPVTASDGRVLYRLLFRRRERY